MSVNDELMHSCIGYRSPRAVMHPEPPVNHDLYYLPVYTAAPVPFAVGFFPSFFNSLTL